MSRDLPAAFVTALQGKVARPVLFFEGEFKDGWLRLWTGYGDITWGGRTWTGAGTLVGMGTLEEVQQVIASGSSITLAGIPSAIVELAIAQVEQGAPGRVYLGMMNEPQRNFARGASAVEDAAAWRASAISNGLTVTKESSWGDVDGLEVARYRWQGVSSASWSEGTYIDSLSALPVSIGESVHASVFLRWAGGTLAGVNGLVVRLREFVGASSFAESSGNIVNSDAYVLSGLRRYISGGDTVRSQIRLSVNPGALIDVSFDIKGLMLNRGSERALWQPYGLTPWSPLVSDPVLAFAGRLDVPEIHDGEETCTCTITYESRLIDLTTPRELRYTHESQQVLFPDDDAFEYVTSIQDKELQWGS